MARLTTSAHSTRASPHFEKGPFSNARAQHVLEQIHLGVHELISAEMRACSEKALQGETSGSRTALGGSTPQPSGYRDVAMLGPRDPCLGRPQRATLPAAAVTLRRETRIAASGVEQGRREGAVSGGGHEGAPRRCARWGFALHHGTLARLADTTCSQQL